MIKELTKEQRDKIRAIRNYDIVSKCRQMRISCNKTIKEMANSAHESYTNVVNFERGQNNSATILETYLNVLWGFRL